MTEYTISEGTYVKATLYARRRLRAIITGSAFAVPLIALLLPVYNPRPLLAVGIVYAILIVVFLVVAPLVNRWSYRRVYRRNSLLHKPQSFSLSEQQIRFRSENGEARYQPDELKKIKIYSDMVLIYPITNVFHMIPRSVLSSRDLELLRRHCT